MRVPLTSPRPQSSLEKRLFTVEEANATIPRLETWLGEMRQLKRRMEQLGTSLEPVIASAYLNSGGPDASRFIRYFHRYRLLAGRIEDEGILLRDVEMGLVDFPSRRLEREIYLCWRSGEARVEHWHEVDAGFAGRQRIDEVRSADRHRKPSDEDQT